MTVRVQHRPLVWVVSGEIGSREQVKRAGEKQVPGRYPQASAPGYTRPVLKPDQAGRKKSAGQSSYGCVCREVSSFFLLLSNKIDPRRNILI